MRRLIIIGTAVAVLGAAAVAYAATLNTYTASLSFTTSKAGSKKSPVPLGFTETLGAANATSGKVAAPLINIKTTIYGAVSNLKDFKTCSSKVIDTPPKYNTACPKGSEVASGAVKALLTTSALTASSPCDPNLAVYAGGGNTEWYFFTSVGTQCGTLHTGSTAPYEGTVKQSGKNLVLNVPLPPDVSTRAGNLNGVYGSLVHEVLKVNVMTTKVHGKKVPAMASVACKGNKRPWSVTFTAVPTAGAPGVSATKSGSSKC